MKDAFDEGMECAREVRAGLTTSLLAALAFVVGFTLVGIWQFVCFIGRGVCWGVGVLAHMAMPQWYTPEVKAEGEEDEDYEEDEYEDEYEDEVADQPVTS